MANQGHPPQRSPGAPAQMPRAPAWLQETMLSEAGNTSWQYCSGIPFSLRICQLHLMAAICQTCCLADQALLLCLVRCTAVLGDYDT